MHISFCDILQRVLFYGEGRKRLVAVVSSKQGRGGADAPVERYAAVVEGCDPVHYLPDDEGFPAALKALVDEQKPDDVFVVPPFKGKNRLSGEFRQAHPRRGIEEVVLATLSASLPSGSRVAAFLPSGFLSHEHSRDFRETFFAQNTLKYAFTPDFDPGQFELVPHAGMLITKLINAFVFHVGISDPTLRVFYFARPAPCRPPLIEDLDNLIRKRSGHTQYGYILKEGLAPGMPIEFNLYSPGTRSKCAGSP